MELLANPKDLDVMLKEKKSPAPGADGCSKHGSNAMSLGIWWLNNNIDIWNNKFVKECELQRL